MRHKKKGGTDFHTASCRQSAPASANRHAVVRAALRCAPHSPTYVYTWCWMRWGTCFSAPYYAMAGRTGRGSAGQHCSSYMIDGHGGSPMNTEYAK